MGNDKPKKPEPRKGGKAIRGAIQAIGGAIPFAGGLASWVSSSWSEKEQEEVNNFMHAWIEMFQDELKEKEKTIKDILSRLDLANEEIAKRVKSSEYQSLIKRTFRNWAGTESEEKQTFVRNILTNAASSSQSSDDVIKLFLDWIQSYSDLHFQVIAEVYSNPGITRNVIWSNLKGAEPRDDSADAGLFRLLIRDLSTGGIISHPKKVDLYGNKIAAPRVKNKSVNFPGSTKTLETAFEPTKPYELTSLGKDFVHYAMTEITVKIEYSETEKEDE